MTFASLLEFHGNLTNTIGRSLTANEACQLLRKQDELVDLYLTDRSQPSRAHRELNYTRALMSFVNNEFVPQLTAANRRPEMHQTFPVATNLITSIRESRGLHPLPQPQPPAVATATRDNTAPEPPSLVASIQAARGAKVTPEPVVAGAGNRSAVPEPPSLVDAIRENRKGGAR